MYRQRRAILLAQTTCSPKKEKKRASPSKVAMAVITIVISIGGLPDETDLGFSEPCT
jgi:hypothetical protein